MPAWNAKWISYVYDPRQDLGVCAFRRVFHGRDSSQIRVSADNRYKLYCNGRLVGLGPQRGDERHWFYETYDLAPFLTDGPNELLALVWNFGWMAPMAQHTVRTAFVCEDLGSGELSTPGHWEVARVPGWDFDMMHSGVGEFYIDVGPGEIIQGGIGVSPMVCTGVPPVSEGRDLYLNVARMEWRTPNVICTAEDRGSSGGGTPWMLIPANLPPQRYIPSERTPTCHERGSKRFLDFGELLCAYPRVRAIGPAGTELRITYAESLWVPGTNEKGNRNETDGKEIRGYQDRFILSGGDDVFEPLWWRTFRFVEIEPYTGETPVQTISGTPMPQVCFEVFETGYPYKVESSFEADDPWVSKIWDVSVRTAQRCAGETYFDCPYYEQLQYVGDSRIQALIGYYLGRDRRLQRNCIDQIGWSLMENGLTQSRYPSRQTQVIPPFSLWWVMMLYDQMLYDRVRDPTSAAFVDKVIIRWMSEDPGFWNFGDWVPCWRWGVPPGHRGSTLHQLTLMLAWRGWHALAGLGSEFPDHLSTHDWKDAVSGLAKAPNDPDWMPSEHAEALSRCIQTMAGQDPDPWPAEALAAANAAKCTYYFSYYKHLAMFGRSTPPPSPLPASGEGEFDYLDQLAPWKEQIENGLTTFAENPEPTRSDCHAWSAHPILGFFQIVAGVTSIAPGWKKAKIMPHPGNLKRFDARIAHPDGQLQVKFEDGRLEIDSPVPFDLAWHGKRATFTAGRHRVS